MEATLPGPSGKHILVGDSWESSHQADEAATDIPRHRTPQVLLTNTESLGIPLRAHAAPTPAISLPQDLHLGAADVALSGSLTPQFWAEVPPP